MAYLNIFVALQEETHKPAHCLFNLRPPFPGLLNSSRRAPALLTYPPEWPLGGEGEGFTRGG